MKMTEVTKKRITWGAICFVLFVVLTVGVYFLWANWGSVEAVASNAKLYTLEQLDAARQEAYAAALGDKAVYENTIRDLRAQMVFQQQQAEQKYNAMVEFYEGEIQRLNNQIAEQSAYTKSLVELMLSFSTNFDSTVTNEKALTLQIQAFEMMLDNETKQLENNRISLNNAQPLSEAQAFVENRRASVSAAENDLNIAINDASYEEKIQKVIDHCAVVNFAAPEGSCSICCVTNARTIFQVSNIFGLDTVYINGTAYGIPNYKSTDWYLESPCRWNCDQNTTFCLLHHRVTDANAMKIVEYFYSLFLGYPGASIGHLDSLVFYSADININHNAETHSHISSLDSYSAFTERYTKKKEAITAAENGVANAKVELSKADASLQSLIASRSTLEYLITSGESTIAKVKARIDELNKLLADLKKETTNEQI